MARGTRTVYPDERNKGLTSTFQPPEEGRSVQRLKRCDKHGDKDEDNSFKNVNNAVETRLELTLCHTPVVYLRSFGKDYFSGIPFKYHKMKF